MNPYFNTFIDSCEIFVMLALTMYCSLSIAVGYAVIVPNVKIVSLFPLGMLV